MTQQIHIPKSQIVYGDIVYWICVTSAILCTVGPLIALIGPDNNIINPHFLFAGIWEGKNAMEVWSIAEGGYPGGHFYLDHLTKGDGFTQLGLALGGGCALPALLGSAFAFLKEKQALWFLMSLWVAFMIFVSATGMVNAGH